MPRNKSKKRFQKFLAARQQRWRQTHANMEGLKLLWLDILCTVLVPFLLLTVYLALRAINVFTPLYPVLHLLAGIVLTIWAVMAYRGVKGYWSYKTHFFFGSVCVLMVLGGSCWKIGEAQEVKVWLTPPAYTQLPMQEIKADQSGSEHSVIEGSSIRVEWDDAQNPPTVRFAGHEERIDQADGLSLVVPPVAQQETMTLLVYQGWKRLAVWTLHAVADAPPKIEMTEEPEITARKTIRFAYKASDDYGVERVLVRIAPSNSVAGVSMEPVELDLATPSAKTVETASYTDLTSLPWAGVAVTVQMIAVDGAGQKAWSNPYSLTLPTRAFRNPFARALIEERKKLLAQPDAAARDEAANVMAGIARQQTLYKGDPIVMMALRAGAVRLVLNEARETIPAVVNLLWKTSVRLEEGTIGGARQDLAEAERDLTAALTREVGPESIRPYVVRVREAMGEYFEEMEAERARQPPGLQELDWPLATASEMLTPEDLQNRLTTIEDHIVSGDRGAARKELSLLQSLIENLRTTPPELTPAQAQLVTQVTALRALVRNQKSLAETTAKLPQDKTKTLKDRDSKRASFARLLAEQQLLLSALRDVTGQEGLSNTYAQESENIMQDAVKALQKEDVVAASESQAAVLDKLQKTLDMVMDQMRRSMTATAPNE